MSMSEILNISALDIIDDILYKKKTTTNKQNLNFNGKGLVGVCLFSINNGKEMCPFLKCVLEMYLRN